MNENAALVLSPLQRSPAELLRYAGVADAQVERLSRQLVGRLVVVLAERYGLDPALKHVEVIPARGGLTVYITADGWRYIAGRSGELDGLTFADVSRGDHGWRATAHAWRKHCAHPFEGRAGAGDSEKLDDPEAIAMTRATRRALRNGWAADIRVEAEYVQILSDDVDVIEPEAAGGATVEPAREVGPIAAAPGPEPGGLAELPVSTRVVPRPEGQSAAHAAVGKLPKDAQHEFMAAHDIKTFGEVWPDRAVAEALELPF